MKHFSEVACGVGLAASLVAGCSASPETSPSTPQIDTMSPSSSAPTIVGPTIPPTKSSSSSSIGKACPATGNKMYLENIPQPDANVQLGTLQAKVGIAATKALVNAPSFTFTVAGKTVTTRVGIPKDPQARCQTVIFTANSAEAGDIFASLGDKDLASTRVSTTQYSLTKNAAGKLVMSGISVSVVGQETDGPGLFQNITTERCQGLELATDTTDTKLYDAEKEAICNTWGIAADTAMLKDGYAKYKARVAGQVLGPDVNQTGTAITYPVASPAQYSQLQADLNAAGLIN